MIQTACINKPQLRKHRHAFVVRPERKTEVKRLVFFCVSEGYAEENNAVKLSENNNGAKKIFALAVLLKPDIHP